MNTLKSKFGFFSIIALVFLGLSSCEEAETARAEITVLQEYTATQGQVLQTRPVEGAEVRFYVPLQGTEHLEAIEFTDINGRTSFSYEYQSLILIEVIYDGEIHNESVRMNVGETVRKEVILPE